jgi:hypothetical protein
MILILVPLPTAGGGWCRELTSSKQVRHSTALLYLYIFFLLLELKNVNFDNSLEQLSHCFFNARK